jgi:hypothetical protein
VQGTLDQLQRGHVQASARPAPGLSGDALLGGRGNLLPQIKVALGDRMTADDRITLDIVAGFFEYLFQEPSLPDEMKVVFGQLQVPVLKAALLDRRLFSDAAHPARAFVDTLADAAAGLDVQREDDAALLQLARRLVAYIRDQFGDDVSVFAGAQLELDSFLNQERVRRAERMSRAMEPLVREDAHAAARAEVEPELTARLVGKAVPLAIKTFLENEWLDHLATVYREQGAASEAWRKELEVLTDLSWSLTPKMNDNDRRRLAQVAPQLVRAFNQGRPVEAAAEPRRKAFLASLFMRHVKALRGSDELPPDSGMRPGQAAAREDEQDEFDDQVAELIRGDWLEFQRPEEDRRIIAKLAWRSPQRTRLLFTYRDGSMAFVHSPDTLAEEFRNGRARIAMEAGPLFERAIARMIGRYRKAASRTGSAARGP